ncbi:unannotated protein [freshwater metagenome]|uniref:Unannotated protein n=1 Tax=freshwater metagenome TaxID=449393 RepID=A0A6J7E191_9ZZZZ
MEEATCPTSIPRPAAASAAVRALSDKCVIDVDRPWRRSASVTLATAGCSSDMEKR